MKLYFVYILECSDDSYYTGMTSDLEKRILEHNTGKYSEAYTFLRRPVKLKWIQQFVEPNLALAVEKQIKGWSRKKKQALINGDLEILNKLSKNYTQFGKPD